MLGLNASTHDEKNVFLQNQEKVHNDGSESLGEESVIKELNGSEQLSSFKV